MTPEREEQLLNLKDELLQAIARVDELLCGLEAAEDDDEVGDNTAVVKADPERKRVTPIQYDLRSLKVAFKESRR